jgi:hypothetical protein
MPWNEVPAKWKAGSLHSGGPSGPVVHSQAQAVAIMLSEKKKAAEGKTEYQPHDRAKAVAAKFRRRNRND